MSFLDFAKRIVTKVAGNLIHKQARRAGQQRCKGCRWLKYDKSGGHWCTKFAENCASNYIPIGNCYEEVTTDGD